MELRVAMATCQNHLAAAWSVFARVRRGNQATRSTDMPLAFLRSSADPERLISHGAEYDAEIVRQVSQKWAAKPISRAAVEYMIEHSGLARRALPKLVEPSAWLDSELAMQTDGSGDEGDGCRAVTSEDASAATGGRPRSG